MDLRPRERLLATATTLFCRHGVHLGVERIAAEANVALMTVYRHFGGKEGLVAAALAHWSDQWLRRVEDGLGRVAGGPTSPLDDLWKVLEDWVGDADFTGSLVADAAMGRGPAASMSIRMLGKAALGQEGSNSPSRAPARNARHSGRVKVSVLPSRSLESRTATCSAAKATSTQSLDAL